MLFVRIFFLKSITSTLIKNSKSNSSFFFLYFLNFFLISWKCSGVSSVQIGNHYIFSTWTPKFTRVDINKTSFLIFLWTTIMIVVIKLYMINWSMRLKFVKFTTCTKHKMLNVQVATVHVQMCTKKHDFLFLENYVLEGQWGTYVAVINKTHTYYNYPGRQAGRHVSTFTYGTQFRAH